ncbi:MAG: ribbon-helix-helix protein, CopG family [Candidatus Omnitrophica bacterium]|nr:ribbon-helix-helix protein, CopG family [Candidatus Omnitrophota bacterium]
MNIARLTVTIPREKYERIEKEKNRRGLNRSAFVNQAIDSFFQKEDEAEKDKKYVAGYKKKPENRAEVEALTKSSAEIWGEF